VIVIVIVIVTVTVREIIAVEARKQSELEPGERRVQEVGL
jgi:hypothetical protein